MKSFPVYLISITVLFTVFSITLTSCSNSSDSSQTRPGERYVIQCESTCDSVSAKITALGGKVTINYSNVNALAIDIPASIIENVQTLNGLKAIAKDRIVRIPEPAAIRKVTLTGTQQPVIYQSKELNALLPTLPANYNYNNLLNGATELHLNNLTGSGVVVAIIDTGTANNADIVPSLAGSVIGGESFVPDALPGDPAEPSATSTLNDSHGTWIGGMIASHIALVIPTDNPLVQSLLTHSPESVLPNDATTSLVPVIGTAPEASLYALKVFPANGNGAPSSRIILAMDRAITLKQNFNSNIPVATTSGDGSEDNPFVYDSLNIQVVNMSLGGATLFPGLDVEDILTREMLMAGITVITAAGNEGPGALTTSSPSTGVGSLSIGAANTPVHERVVEDVFSTSGVGAGTAFRPDDNIQIALFSSRGPVPNGQRGVDLVANGYASFTQGADGFFSFINGTSLSTPTVTGAAALLFSAVPGSNAKDVRKALMMSANAALLGANASSIDTGNGFLNIPAALAMLMAGPDASIPDLPFVSQSSSKVEDNISLQNLDTIEFTDGEYTTNLVDLVPGQVAHIFVPTSADTGNLVVTISEIVAELPPAEQNVFFGDDIVLTILDAPTTFNDEIYFDFLTADKTIDIPFPQEGLIRLAVMGDWTNAGKVSARISITETKRDLSRPVVSGEVEDQQIDTFVLEVEEDAQQIVFELFWKNNWGSFPTHDIDLILVDPQNELYFEGATLRSPERVVINNPVPGDWTVIVEGFTLHGFEDDYTLRATDQSGDSLELGR